MQQQLEQLSLALEPYPWAYTLLVLALLLLAAWLANWVTKHVLITGLRRGLKATPLGARMRDDNVEMRVIPRLANVVPALVIAGGITLVPALPGQVVTVVQALCQVFIVLTVALAVSRALDLANKVYERRPDAQNRPIKGYLQVVKIVMYVLVAISVIATLIGAEFLHILTGLGAMTAVMMLVFQDTILSLVASVQISSDGRVRIGDWIEMPGQNADGDVIDISLHTITVKNWDKTDTRVPTKYLISESFKNWRGMTDTGARRIKRSLNIDQRSVRFLEPEEIENLHRFMLLDDYLSEKEQELAEWNGKLAERGGSAEVNHRRVTNLGTFRMYVNQYLENHPGLHHGMTTLVRQHQPTEAGIPLELWCFTHDVRWIQYESVQSDIFDHLLAIMPEFGLRVFQRTSDAPLDVKPLDVNVRREDGERADGDD